MRRKINYIVRKNKLYLVFEHVGSASILNSAIGTLLADTI